MKEIVLSSEERQPFNKGLFERLRRGKAKARKTKERKGKGREERVERKGRQQEEKKEH